jgi:flagellar FliL protein
MKKNLLSILILALLIVNLALTVITMMSVTGTNKKTAALVDTIATVLNLELVTDEEDPASEISLADTVIYNIADSMTIPIKPGDDGKQVYMVCNIALSLNTKDEDYKQYSAETIGTYEPYIKQAIEGVAINYDQAYITSNRDEFKKEVLSAVQQWLGSKVVYDISISDVKFG